MFAKLFVISIMIVAFHVNPNSVVGIYYEMAWSAVRGYRSMVSADADSLVVSLIMPMLKCCGVQNGEDFKGSPNFERKLVHGAGVTTISTPLPCCKLRKSYEPIYRSCPKEFDERNSNYKTGCWPILEKQIQAVYAKMSYAVIFTALCELGLASLAIYLSVTLG
ncbi:Tetraspanin-16 [Fasciola gigantica]|uniref:Tetraspanin-16 n=1 Tax=Fasciola gigantica TaxID=46835 RepID=A0A504YZH2_FASGI|nr:Tetraspanin-16 [Fasciola gigantica]